MGPGKEWARKIRISPNVYKIYDVCAADLIHPAVASRLGSSGSTILG